LDISNARNSVVVNHVRLKFYTSIFGAIIKSLLAKKGIFSMMNFRHSSTLTSPFCASVLPVVLLITKGDSPTDINIAEILHLSNFFELKRTLVYIHLQLRTRKVLDIQLVCLISYKYSSSKFINKGFVYITDLALCLNLKLKLILRFLSQLVDC
jgi:hypothetical protein